MSTTTAQDLLDRTTAIRGNNTVDITYYKNRTLLNGALIGGAGGAYFGYAKKGNMLLTTLLGAIGGMIIAGLFIPKS